MSNTAAFEALAAFAAMTYLAVNKGLIKQITKYLAMKTYIFVAKKLTFEWWEKAWIRLAVAIIATVLTIAGQSFDMVVITDNLSEDWQWIADVESISVLSCFGLAAATGSLLYYCNLATTIVAITVGSAMLHRIEKLISQNGYIANVFVQWLIARGMAYEESTRKDTNASV